MKKQGLFEKITEEILWTSRYAVLIAVAFSLIASFSMFILGSAEILNIITETFPLSEGKSTSKFVAVIIGAIDLYLIAIVLLIFTFGIYELFISKIDIAYKDKEINILEITNLDQLKNKIFKLIIMVLAITFFKNVLEIPQETNIDLLYMALSILAITFGFYFMHKLDTPDKTPKRNTKSTSKKN